MVINFRNSIAKCRCLVDGGANRWLDFLEECSELGSFENPDLVTGDFDSITEQTMTHFKKLSSTKIVHTPNQDHTDFTKSLMELPPYITNENVSGCRDFRVKVKVKTNFSFR